MHALITGAPGSGKSTLIHRVLEELKLPVWGYESKKEPALADSEGMIPVYLYEIGRPHLQTGENLAGCCNGRGAHPNLAAFDRFAPKLSAPVPENTLVVLDEIGIMESKSEPFTQAILALLDGDAPVIAAVKSKHTPFLETVRSHPKARCFYLTPENREETFRQVVAFLKEQLP